MAISVGFGVLFATVITLILLPILMIMIITDDTLASPFRFYKGLLSRRESIR